MIATRQGNPSLNELTYVSFHPLEVVFRYRDPQLPVKITHICLNWD